MLDLTIIGLLPQQLKTRKQVRNVGYIMLFSMFLNVKRILSKLDRWESGK